MSRELEASDLARNKWMPAFILISQADKCVRFIQAIFLLISLVKRVSFIIGYLVGISSSFGSEQCGHLIVVIIIFKKHKIWRVLPVSYKDLIALMVGGGSFFAYYVLFLILKTNILGQASCCFFSVYYLLLKWDVEVSQSNQKFQFVSLE